MKQKSFAERGQVLILIALAAIGLVAIVALAIDGGIKYSDRRHAQNAADTAALAAALLKVDGLTAGETDSVCSTDSGYTNSSFCLDIIYAAWDRAEENGYDGLLSNDVDVYSPPISGYYAGNSSYVQVIITSRVDTFFARVIGIGQTQNTVQAVAYLRKGGYLGDGAMLISYDPDPNCSVGGTGGYSVSVSGSSTVNLSGGGIFVNSDEVCGFVIPNCADLHITGGAINSAGNNIDTGSCTFSPPLTSNINQTPVIIPDDVEWPDVPDECNTSAPTPTLLGTDPNDGKAEWLIYPGFYTDFPQAALIPNNKHIYMSSGVYCIDPPHGQDLSWSGSSFLSLNGSTAAGKNPRYHSYNPDGVTLYIRSGGGFSLSINSPILLDASTTGDYQGYLIILEGNHTSIENCGIEGGAYLDINGLVFAPYCDITVNGGSDPTAEINAQLMGWDLKINGTTTINFNYDPSNQVQIRRRIGLMR
jgi:putative Flp pilus-assembly TadE/G-like protein